MPETNARFDGDDLMVEALRTLVHDELQAVLQPISLQQHEWFHDLATELRTLISALHNLVSKQPQSTHSRLGSLNQQVKSYRDSNVARDARMRGEITQLKTFLEQLPMLEEIMMLVKRTNQLAERNEQVPERNDQLIEHNNKRMWIERAFLVIFAFSTLYLIVIGK